MAEPICIGKGLEPAIVPAVRGNVLKGSGVLTGCRAKRELSSLLRIMTLGARNGAFGLPVGGDRTPHGGTSKGGVALV